MIGGRVEARVWDSVGCSCCSRWRCWSVSGLPLYDGNRDREQSSRTARETLDERFSKGEIDREEYEMRRKALIG